MKQFNVLLLLVLIPVLGFSQTISGKLLNESNQPIPYATLQVGPNYGVITNEEGIFNLETEGFLATDNVIISCLGYESLSLKISDFESKTYVLKEAEHTLSEVFITNRNLSIEEILDSVRVNLSKNYSKLGAHRVFMRQTNNYDLQDIDFDIAKSTNLNKSRIKRFNKSFDSLKGQFTNETSKHYKEVLFDFIKNEDSSSVAVVKATKLINKTKDLSTEAVNEKMVKTSLNLLDSSATYKLKSGLFTLEDSVKVGGIFNAKVNPEKGSNKALKEQIQGLVNSSTPSNTSVFDFLFEDNKYDYSQEGISVIGDISAYKISFTPRRRSSKYIGYMYINTSDFAILKLDYGFAEDKKGKKLNLKLVLGVKYEENHFKSTILFKKNENSTYELQFVSLETGNYIYLNRSLKFIRNKMEEEDDKQILKLKFMVEQTYNDKVELFFINNETHKSLEYKKEYPISYISKYDPSIWKDYNVLSPVQDIIDYETD